MNLKFESFSEIEDFSKSFFKDKYYTGIVDNFFSDQKDFLNKAKSLGVKAELRRGEWNIFGAWFSLIELLKDFEYESALIFEGKKVKEIGDLKTRRLEFFKLKSQDHELIELAEKYSVVFHLSSSHSNSIDVLGKKEEIEKIRGGLIGKA